MAFASFISILTYSWINPLMVSVYMRSCVLVPCRSGYMPERVCGPQYNVGRMIHLYSSRRGKSTKVRDGSKACPIARAYSFVSGFSL